MITPEVGGRRSRSFAKLLGALPKLALLVLVWHIGARVVAWQRSMRVLERFAAPELPSSPAIAELTHERPWQQTQLRWGEYRPAAPRATLLLVHGVNSLGLAEPRLVRFSRALASEGYRVLTPELPELAAYRLETRSIERIAAITHIAAEETGDAVGVIGTSFAGGLAVLAATRPNAARDFKFVLSLGGHEDVARVGTYLVTGAIEDPFGTQSPVPPHDYGMLVLLHSRAERFFPPAQLAPAERALAHWLRGERDEARATLATMESSLRADLLALLERGERGPFAAQVLDDLREHPVEWRALSPRSALAQLRVPVYLLHGSGDSVIPAVESEHFAVDAKAWVARSLISPAIVHVEVGKGPNRFDQLALVDFLAEALQAAER